MALQSVEAIQNLIHKLEQNYTYDIKNVRFLIYGHKGWIGGSVRVHNTAEVESEIESISPTHIICAIGRTHGTMDDGTKINNIDYLESLDKTMENVHDNLFA
eukprot:641016_1